MKNLGTRWNLPDGLPLGLALILSAQLVMAGMPAAQQNELVQTRCAVCHDDAHRNGGLSLQHFDAAHVAPSLAAIMLSKLRSGALGASGMKLPDKATEQAFTDAFIAQAAGADQWFVEQAQTPIVTASIVKELPGARGEGRDPAVYRLIVSCNTKTRQGEMQLAWAPQPVSDRTMLASIDGKTNLAYWVEGKEAMGNGSAAITGPASMYLYNADSKAPLALPAQKLSISELFPAESVAFPFSSLPQKARAELSQCFAGR